MTVKMNMRPGQRGIVTQCKNGNTGRILTCIEVVTMEEEEYICLDPSQSPWWLVDSNVNVPQGRTLPYIPDAAMEPLE